MDEWTIWLVLVFLSFLVLELRALVRGTPTLTAYVRGLAKKYPWLSAAFVIGCILLAGHFFWGWF